MHVHGFVALYHHVHIVYNHLLKWKRPLFQTLYSLNSLLFFPGVRLERRASIPRVPSAANADIVLGRGRTCVSWEATSGTWIAREWKMQVRVCMPVTCLQGSLHEDMLLITSSMLHAPCTSRQYHLWSWRYLSRPIHPEWELINSHMYHETSMQWYS